ncbi:hypothetical protein [Phenylobacterium sp.]|jgi:hypothetical protein
MAKGQKRTNREIRKPKQEKVKPSAATQTFLGAATAAAIGPRR